MLLSASLAHAALSPHILAAESAQDDAGRESAKKLVRIAKDAEVWIDSGKRTVIVGGEVCLREGMLEMFACPQGTKEHESIIAVNTKAYIVHAALLAVNARPGTPVRFDPEYAPASGSEVDVRVVWLGDDGKENTVAAQEWVRNVKTQKAMQHPWIFAGSGFWEDEETGKRYYYAEGGELICVSNFPTATLDVPVASSQANAELLFEAYTERIPPRGTKVKLLLSPKKVAGVDGAAEADKPE
jgi:hypothetical protein